MKRPHEKCMWTSRLARVHTDPSRISPCPVPGHRGTPPCGVLVFPRSTSGEPVTSTSYAFNPINNVSLYRNCYVVTLQHGYISVLFILIFFKILQKWNLVWGRLCLGFLPNYIVVTIAMCLHSRQCTFNVKFKYIANGQLQNTIVQQCLWNTIKGIPIEHFDCVAVQHRPCPKK